jgi:hypothetical protein
MGDGFMQTMSSQGQTSQLAQDRYHGAAEVIHAKSHGLNTTFRVYRDGIRVGCSFLTNDAIKFIMDSLEEAR